MNVVFKRIIFYFFLLFISTLALFPQQIILKCIAWKATNYCKQAFCASFSFEDLVWDEGKIQFKNGKLSKKGEIEARFENASLLPFINVKERKFGGELKLKGLKIVHLKKESRPIPNPPSPTFKLFTLCLDTTIEGAELFLYDYLSTNHLFQHVCFDLVHHVQGNQTSGTISFDFYPEVEKKWNFSCVKPSSLISRNLTNMSTMGLITHDQAGDFHHHIEEPCHKGSFVSSPRLDCLNIDTEIPKFTIHFKDVGALLELSAHFQSHSFPDLAHLITYFFQSYLPKPSFHWDILRGTIDGDLKFAIAKGAPLSMKGNIKLNGVQGENPSFNLLAELDHLHCMLDVDFTKAEEINGEFILEGGRLALREKEVPWEDIWDIKNMHSTMHVKEGKVESSTINGCFMGMEGAFILDWQSDSKLMHMEFKGFSKEMQDLFPESFKKRFSKAFPNDFFKVNVNVQRAKEGLELKGELAILDELFSSYSLSFGCLLGGVENEIEIESVVPHNLTFSLTRSVNAFLIRLKQQFCLSQKRYGWFKGEQFPLEKFLSPFLFHDIRMNASGFANFSGTFDDQYLIISYEGRDFELESPYFTFHADSIKEDSLIGISAIHYIDLKTWNHVGFLPLKDAMFWHKNSSFRLEKADALVNFENNAIYIQKISANAEGLEIEGDVDITIKSLNDIDLKITADHLKGSASSAQRVLAHFKPLGFWHVPLDGEVLGKKEALFFHYHFSPTAVLKEGKMLGEMCLSMKTPFFCLNKYHAYIAYDCVENILSISNGEGGFTLPKRADHLTIYTPSIILNDIPDFLLNFSCTIKDADKIWLSVKGKTEREEEGKKLTISGNGKKPFESICIQAVQKNRQEGALKFTFGEWKGVAEIECEDKNLRIEHLVCTSDQGASFSFCGDYDKINQILKGTITDLTCALTSLSAPFGYILSQWKPNGEITGYGSIEWKIGKEIQAHASLSLNNLELGGMYFAGCKNLLCSYSNSGLSIEGLEVEIPLGEGAEKYKLGRFHYDASKPKILFEGFDFSLPPEKLPWAAEIASVFFPGKIHPFVMKWIETLKKKEPLEGRISIAAEPNNVSISFNLKDGVYHLLNKTLDLKHFHLIYDPENVNIWTQCRYQEKYYWLHLNGDSSLMSSGVLALSENELSQEKEEEVEVLKAEWSREEGNRWDIKKIEGNFCGIDVALSTDSQTVINNSIALKGDIIFDPLKIKHLLNSSLRNWVDKLGIAGRFSIQGSLLLDQQDFSNISFLGDFSGTDCTIAHIALSSISSQCFFTPNTIKFSDIFIKDWAGSLTAGQTIFSRLEKEWNLNIDRLTLTDLRLSRLKSPWTQWNARDRPFFKSLFIPSFVLENFSTKLGNSSTIIGSGKLEFTNLPKKTIFSNLLFLPTEITARIGLDLSNLVPVRGTIEYALQDEKIIFNEFKDMYSDGKRSRFYLAEAPAFIDFKGNLNMKVKMKQYNLLMKLAEFFTIHVKGTLLHPSYTFSNHTDEEDS